ncbi:disulfide bond formation protein DsbE [beta proteobacterium AAP99]|nr:disulfide bond formation protein DsbE [beta proteobacterium AAP99]
MIGTVLRTSACAAFAAALVLTVPLSAHAVSPGDMAPAFDLPGTTQPVRLADLKGKFVYVDFWASWCGPCRQSFPWLNDMQAKYGAQGLTVVGINVDTKREDALAFLKEVPANFRLAFDAAGSSPKAYKIKGMPSSILVGPDGKVIFHHAGFRPENRAELEEKIRKALRGA